MNFGVNIESLGKYFFLSSPWAKEEKILTTQYPVRNEKREREREKERERKRKRERERGSERE